MSYNPDWKMHVIFCYRWGLIYHVVTCHCSSNLDIRSHFYKQESGVVYCRNRTIYENIESIILGEIWLLRQQELFADC